MRDIKTIYADFQEACVKDNVVDNEAFDKFFKEMDPEERTFFLNWVFRTVGEAIGALFTKAGKMIDDALGNVHIVTNTVHAINITQLFESSHDDIASPLVFEDGIKNALSQAFVKGKWPVQAASFNEVFIAASEGRIRFNHSIGTELLILGAFDDVVNAEWENPSLGAIIKEVMHSMGYSSNIDYPGWLAIHSSQIGLTGELKQPEQVKEESNE